ncbi:MAG: alpha/beta fold hydrolase [Rubrivivax sp.]
MNITRRLLLAALASAALIGCTTAPPAAPTAAAQPPIVLVHGNGDNAALWQTTIWRFESNGWPSDRLVAIDMPNPLARDDDTKPQPGRSSAEESAKILAAAVDQVLQRTGARQVVLVANSRGGNAVRNYVQNFGGAAKVSHVVLGGTPNHGVWADAALRPNSEFNGAGPFLLGLNAPKGANGDEVTPGPKWLTVRSNNNDKFAQPDGVWIGSKGKPTHVSFDGPALKGATNVVLDDRDHREVSFHALAFEQAYTFITGHAPARLDIVPQAAPVLDGLVSGYGPAGHNLPLVSATLEVFAVDAASGQRVGAARYRTSVGADGRWGPFTADPNTPYEFVVAAIGYAQTHVYRSPFPRSSNVVNLRAERLAAADSDAAAVITLSRPRGYFGVPRDRIVFDGISPAPGLPTGVAGVSSSKIKLKEGAGRSIVAEFESGAINERIVGIAWPAEGNRVVILELTQ